MKLSIINSLSTGRRTKQSQEQRPSLLSWFMLTQKHKPALRDRVSADFDVMFNDSYAQESYKTLITIWR